ncbi:MAG: hypothetical protein WKG07_21580 [Hymenobacter sp.]
MRLVKAALIFHYPPVFINRRLANGFFVDARPGAGAGRPLRYDNWRLEQADEFDTPGDSTGLAARWAFACPWAAPWAARLSTIPVAK